MHDTKKNNLKKKKTLSSSSVVKEFYLNNLVDLSYLTDCKWRYFRFCLPNGRFFKLPYHIKDSRTLNKWILKRKPLDVYYSSSCWLSPYNVGAKSEVLSDNLFLFSDLVFDIDGKYFSNKHIENARKETIKLINYLEAKNIEIKYLAFSGSKGFHVICKEPIRNDVKFDSPLKREENAKLFRKEITKEIIDNNIRIDTRVTVDSRRIMRVPGTINSKSGYCCRIIQKKELYENNAKNIIKNTKRIDINKLKRELRYNNSKTNIRNKIYNIKDYIPFLNKFEDNHYSLFYFASFLSNRVDSTKLFVPIIESKKTTEKSVSKQIETILDTYNLSEAFLFKGDNFFVIIPFALQKRRVEKILKAADSENYTSFLKYHQTFTRISEKLDLKLNTVLHKPYFIKKIKNNNENSNKLVSASHQHFLIDKGIEFDKYQRITRSKAYIIRHTVIEN